MSKPVVLIDAGELVGLSGSAEGDVLKWDAGLGQWYAAPGGGTGTVTSVTAGAGLSGGTITTSGTISMPSVGTAGSYGSASSVPVITTDAQGRVSGVVPTSIAIEQSAVDGLVSALAGKVSTGTQVTAGIGLSGGGALSGNVTISLPSVGTEGTYGSASSVAVVTTDAQGRVSGATTTAIAIEQSAVDGLVTDLSGKVPTTRTISTTSGQLTGGGALSGNLTLGLATAGTSGDYGSASSVPVIHTDAYGRVTSATSTTIDIATSQVSGLDMALAGKALKTTTISSGTGILVTGGGTLGDDNTISLASGVVTAATKGSASKSATVTVDTYGRTTSLSDQDIAIAASQVTSGQISLVRGGTGIDASGVTAGELLVGATGGGALALQTVSQDATLASTGAVTVKGLQTVPVATTAPASGQVLQYDGTNWTPGVIPTGGSGGGGITYYLDYGTTTGISPTTGLPQTPVATSLLGRSHVANATPLTSADLVNGTPSLICGFVTAVTDPSVTDVPAGLWDFNIWASAPSSTAAGQTGIQARVYRYRSSDSTYLELGRSDLVYLYDLGNRAQYILSVTMAQATILATDRIYIEVWAQKTVSGTRRVMLYFQDDSPSHVHTTLPSVAGTGLVHVINGVFQSPASPADLASSDVTGTLLVANGGTGAATLPIHQVLLGNGTSAIDSVSLAAGQVLVGTTSNSPSAATIGSGTGVTVSSSSGAISIAIGQAVGTGSSVTFGEITDSGLTASQYVKTDGSKKLVSSSTIAAGDLSGTVAVAKGGTGAATTSQRYAFIGPTSGSGAPDFRALVAADISDLASGSVTSIAGTTNQVIASGSTGAVTLSLPQSIGTSSSPTFAGLSLSGLTGYLKGNGGSALSASSTIPTSDLSGTIALSSQVSGTLPVQNGGTGNTSFPYGAILFGQGTGNSGIGVLQGTAAGQILQWQALDGWAPVNSLGAAYGGTGLTSYTAGDILFASGSSTLAKRGIGAAGTVLTSNGTSPQWLAPAASGTVTSVSSSTTLAGLSLATTNGTTTPAISLTGTLGVASGGTGATTLTGYVKGVGTAALTASTTIPAADITGLSGVYAPLASPTFTGTVTIPAGASISGYATLASPTFTGTVTIPAGASISGYAPLASPSFTGTPSLPTGTTGVTQSAGNNTTALATTAFVTSAVSAGQYTLPVATASVLGGVKQGSGVAIDGAGVLSANVLSVAGRTGAVTLSVSDVSGAAPLASPSFSGTPSLPTGTTGVTQSAGNNTTALATTAFVTAAVAASIGAPYDVSGEAAGTLANGDEIWHFKATRAFTLSATAANHLAGAVTAPSGTCVITVYKNTTGTQVFTITYTASATGVIGSVTNNTVAQGDLLFAKITSGPSTISNPYWTFYGTL